MKRFISNFFFYSTVNAYKTKVSSYKPKPKRLDRLKDDFR